MKRFSLLLALLLPLAACSHASLTLHYDRPAESFDEALPLGNGRLGALVSDGYAAWHAYPGYYRSGEGQLLYDPARGIHFRTVLTVRHEGGSVASASGSRFARFCNRLWISVLLFYLWEYALKYNGNYLFDRMLCKRDKV